MAEGDQHRALVRRLEKFAALLRDEIPFLAISLDMSGSQYQTPPRIEGFVPDLLVQTVPQTMTVVGEAKSDQDLESDHSFRQLQGYLRYLGVCERPALVLAISWTVAATAKAIVKKARDSVPESEHVGFYILDGTTSERSILAELCR